MDNEDPAFGDSQAAEPAPLDSSSRTASMFAAYDIQKAFWQASTDREQVARLLLPS